MEIKLEMPGDLFSDEFRVEDFGARVRELAIFELVRVKRMHEHEAQRMLGLERWELIERMKEVGIEPTEQTFDRLKSELEIAVDAKRRRRPLESKEK